MKKNRKFLTAVLMAATLILAGCAESASVQGSTPETDTSSVQEESSSQASGNVFEVGVVQLVDHPSLNTIRDAFISKLDEMMGDQVQVECQDAQNDMSNINSICQKFVGDEKDLIVAIATPTAQAAAAATSEIPILYSAVTDPEAAKLTGLPNVTGTSDAIPVQSIFELAAQLTPEAKNFGLIYNTSEVNSVSVIEEAKAYMDENGYTYTEATITNTSELQQSASSLVGKVDAIFTPIDNTVATAMPVLAAVGTTNKLPVYVGADSMVADGGLATVGIDYSILGTRTAEMASEILGGKQPSEIPYETMSDFSNIINTATAEDLGIEVPQELLDAATVDGE